MAGRFAAGRSPSTRRELVLSLFPSSLARPPAPSFPCPWPTHWRVTCDSRPASETKPFESHSVTRTCRHRDSDGVRFERRLRQWIRTSRPKQRAYRDRPRQVIGRGKRDCTGESDWDVKRCTWSTGLRPKLCPRLALSGRPISNVTVSG